MISVEVAARQGCITSAHKFAHVVDEWLTTHCDQLWRNRNGRGGRIRRKEGSTLSACTFLTMHHSFHHTHPPSRGEVQLLRLLRLLSSDAIFVLCSNSMRGQLGVHAYAVPSLLSCCCCCCRCRSVRRFGNRSKRVRKKMKFYTNITIFVSVTFARSLEPIVTEYKEHIIHIHTKPRRASRGKPETNQTRTTRNAVNM